MIVVTWPVTVMIDVIATLRRLVIHCFYLSGSLSYVRVGVHVDIEDELVGEAEVAGVDETEVVGVEEAVIGDDDGVDEGVIRTGIET